MRITATFILFLANIFKVQSFTTIPSLAPLQYVTLPVIIDYIKDTLTENGPIFLLNSLVPLDRQDYIAIFISEGVSGALGGLAAKVISLIDGNKDNKESSLVSAEVSGAYFGVSAASRSLVSIAGLSPIAVNLFALILATAISEGLKIRGRIVLPQRTRAKGSPTMYDLMKFKNPSMFDLMNFARNGEQPGTPRMPMIGKFTGDELKADIVKWLVVYSLLPSGNTLVELDEAVAIGAFRYAYVLQEYCYGKIARYYT